MGPPNQNRANDYKQSLGLPMGVVSQMLLEVIAFSWSGSNFWNPVFGKEGLH